MALEEHLVTTSTGIDRGLMRDMNFNVCLLWLSNEAKFGLTYGELDRWFLDEFIELSILSASPMYCSFMKGCEN